MNTHLQEKAAQADVDARNAATAIREQAEQVATGVGNFYLVRREQAWRVTNWTGSFDVPAYVATGRHNIARVQRSVTFTGPDGHKWHGRQYGDNGQNFTAKRKGNA